MKYKVDMVAALAHMFHGGAVTPSKRDDVLYRIADNRIGISFTNGEHWAGDNSVASWVYLNQNNEFYLLQPVYDLDGATLTPVPTTIMSTDEGGPMEVNMEVATKADEPGPTSDFSTAEPPNQKFWNNIRLLELALAATGQAAPMNVIAAAQEFKRFVES